VAEKHDFCGIQRKIPQKSDFANDRVMNPFPHGETAADHAKIFAQIFWRKSFFMTKNTIFAKIRSGNCEFPTQLWRKSGVFGL
jgi:beta-galactosidase beta subunit